MHEQTCSLEASDSVYLCEYWDGQTVHRTCVRKELSNTLVTQYIFQTYPEIHPLSTCFVSLTFVIYVQPLRFISQPPILHPKVDIPTIKIYFRLIQDVWSVSMVREPHLSHECQSNFSGRKIFPATFHIFVLVLHCSNIVEKYIPQCLQNVYTLRPTSKWSSTKAR